LTRGKSASPAVDMGLDGIDGQEFKRLVRTGLAWLRRHQATINALNVYPVPDGDTGTNMVLTMQSAWDEVADSSERNIGAVAHQVAQGALMGARGNSGVILSQIWRGFARSLDKKPVYHADDLAAALREAADTAYQGVTKPVEGTILTVARAVADAAKRSARQTADLTRVQEHVVLAAHEAVALTPSLLPVLAEAGVVDAGGQGLLVILEGMLHAMRGEEIPDEAEPAEPGELATTYIQPGEAGYGYDVQFLLKGEGLDVDGIRGAITDMGDCPLVVGDPEMIKVHVHVPDPGVPLSYASTLGSLRDVVVEDMQAQSEDFLAGPASSAPTDEEQQVGVVAVVMGEGLTLLFENLGAGALVHGGQTMNPSTQDLLEAIESLPAESVIVLPNNKNVVLAAEQARDHSDKDVAVVPTCSIPEGIAALLAVNPHADLETNVSTMRSAVEEVETGKVTSATRSATINNVEVANGQLIGLHGEDLKVTGDSAEEVVRALLREIDTEDKEIVTLYYGDQVTESEAKALADTLSEDWPDLEMEVVFGGQPHYHYFLSVE
jgi:DAK2 domain fusion protein YloV